MNTKAILFGGQYPERFWDIWWNPGWTEKDFENQVERQLSPTEVERFLDHSVNPNGTRKCCLGDVGDRFFPDKNTDNAGIRNSEENL
jgi:hypothetical protein